MKKLAVHLHLYYLEQLDEILEKLCNLEEIDFDLFVTMSKVDEEVKRKILNKFSNAKVFVVANRGYDIGPFIWFLHQINLDDYEYVLKVHTKHYDMFDYGCFNGIRIDCKTWAKMLLGALVGSKQVVNDNIKLLDSNPKIGMIGNKFSLTNEEWTYKSLLSAIKKEADKLGLPIVSNYFVAGTMFMCRAHLLKPFLGYKIEDFDLSSALVKDYSLAHVMERLFGFVVQSQGYEIKGVKDRDYKLERVMATITRTLIQKKVTKSGSLTIKICKIPVFSKKVILPMIDVEREFDINSAKHRRLAIYAAYDKYGRIDKADLYYLRALREVCDNVIYVADNGLVQGEVEKVRDIACYVLAKKHGEYDFGSYKRGIMYAKEKGLLDGLDELVICNDSCFAPVHSFKMMFDKMKESQAHFWGVTENIEISRHIQSFFMVFRRKVFESDVFYKFFENVVAEKNVNDVILNYEIGLSKTLFENGFKAEAYIKYPNEGEYPLTIAKGCKNLTLFPCWLIKQGSPLIKKKVFDEKEYACENSLKAKFLCIKNNRSMKNVISSILCGYIKRFLFQKKITKSGKTIVKVCKIPVYSK